MSIHKTLTVLVLGALLLGVATPVVAHDTQNVEGYDITFGGADEPLVTDERMWLEFEIVDNETSEPVANQSETLTASVQTAESEKTEIELGEKHGEPGVYEAPVVFTEPGDYVVHLEGTLEDTEVHTHFEKEVTDRSELEYPSDDSQTAADDTESDTDDSQSDEAGFGPMIVAVAAMGLVAAAGASFLRR